MARRFANPSHSSCGGERGRQLRRPWSCDALLAASQEMDEAGSQGLAGWLRFAFRHYLILLPDSVSTRWDREQEPRFRQSAVVVSDLSNLQPAKLGRSQNQLRPLRSEIGHHQASTLVASNVRAEAANWGGLAVVANSNYLPRMDDCCCAPPPITGTGWPDVIVAAQFSARH